MAKIRISGWFSLARATVPKGPGRPVHYAAALALAAIAFALRVAMAPQTEGIPFLTFFPAATLAAIIGGFGPGMFAGIVGGGLAALLFFETSLRSNVGLALAIYVAALLLICVAAETMHRYIREYAKAAEELELARTAEHGARLTAERANAAKSRFLAAASHDLRQPFQALRLYHAALESLPHDQGAGRLLRHMDVAMAAGENLLRSLLDISRLEAGIVTPQPVALAVTDLFVELEARHRPMAEEKGLRFRSRPSRLTVKADPVLLDRILDNLLANAIRYTERGGVLLGGRRCRGEVWLQVLDTGIGIAPADQEAVFEEFLQLGNPERDRSKGAGLGLAVVRKTAALIGARVTLRSRPGRGTTVTVRLPAGRADPAAGQGAPSTETPSAVNRRALATA